MKCGCTQCGHEFAGMTDFDAHRPGKPGTRRPCLSPAAMLQDGWAQKLRGWCRPGHEQRSAAFAAYRQRAEQHISIQQQQD